MGRFDGAPVDRAAGGVVVRDGSVLVVHRPRYDDWSLPKGHVDAGESWAETARREVLEETGVLAEIAGPAMSIAYPLADEVIKVVVFYPMRPEGGSDELDGDPAEVDQVAWWPIEAALQRLSYADERRVLAALAR